MTETSLPEAACGVAAVQGVAARAVEAKGWRYSPHVIIFFSSACIMILEIVAGRLMARNVGNSLYTWTSIIGVVLAGMSLGNYLGGRMADRWGPRRLLGWLFLIASMACLATPFLNGWISESRWVADLGHKYEINLPTWIVLSALVLFLVPALVLGMISPAAAKLALERSKAVGGTIGAVYAWGAIGSIMGTFAAGFWLIAALGSRGVALAVALMLGLIGFWLGPRRSIHGVWVVIVAALLWLSQTGWDPAYQYACAASLQDGEEYAASPHGIWPWRLTKRYDRLPFAKDGKYQFVKVYGWQQDDEYEGERAMVTLELDNLEHGYVDLNDPSYLEYDYEEVYGELARLFAGGRGQVAALFLGGGSYTFPRWVQQAWPGSQCDVAEIDPLVLEANHQAMGLARDTTIRTLIGDARIVVGKLPALRQYDLILADAFNDLGVPWHLTTLEFHHKLRGVLRPDGVLLSNIIDDVDAGLFLGAYVETVRRVFRHVYVFCTDRDGATAGRDTFVVAATDAEDGELHEQLAALAPGHGGEFPGSLLTDEQLAALKARCGGRVLTDDNAPVENLLEPIVRSKGW